MADANEEILDDAGKLKKALLGERGDHKATKALLHAANLRIGQMEALGVNPDSVRVKSFIDNGIAAGVAAKSVELQQRVAGLEAQLAEANKIAADAAGGLAARTVADELREAARADHVRPEALNDVLTLGQLELKIVDGIVQDAEGRSAADWIDARKHTSPHWWPVSRGAGSRGNAALDGLVDASPNPFTPEGFNLTRQGQMLRENPARAEQLQKSAAAMARN